MERQAGLTRDTQDARLAYSHAPDDWGYLACSTRPGAHGRPEYWVNKCRIMWSAFYIMSAWLFGLLMPPPPAPLPCPEAKLGLLVR